MNVTKVVNLCKENRLQKVNCPYCGSWEADKEEIQTIMLEGETDDRGYPICQEAYSETQECTCKGCSKNYKIYYGRSTYSVYTPPLAQNNIGDIVCLAKFESNWHSNFSIFAATNPSTKTKNLYFINYEDDCFPIFITRSQVLEFLKDHKKAKGYLYCHSMERYR